MEARTTPSNREKDPEKQSGERKRSSVATTTTAADVMPRGDCHDQGHKNTVRGDEDRRPVRCRSQDDDAVRRTASPWHSRCAQHRVKALVPVGATSSVGCASATADACRGVSCEMHVSTCDAARRREVGTSRVGKRN